MGSTFFWFEECQALFLKHLERNNYSLETINGYGKDLKSFQRFISNEFGEEDFSLDKIGRGELLRFLDDGRNRGNQVGTIARRLSTLKSFYKYLIYELDYPIDVAARIRMPKVYVPLKNILTESEIEKLLLASATLGSNYALLFHALYYTGSRLTPIRTLEKKNVLFEEDKIYFPVVKGGKDQYLPLHPKLREMFDDYFSYQLPDSEVFVFPSPRVPNQPLSPSDIRNKLRKAAELAGVDSSITPHTIRHCTATHLTLKNVPQRKIASILGHADLRSTMRYQHLTVEHLRDPLELL